MATDIIIHDEKDNVGVVVIDKITQKQDCACWIMENDKTVQIQSVDEIQLGHNPTCAILFWSDFVNNNYSYVVFFVMYYYICSHKYCVDLFI